MIKAIINLLTSIIQKIPIKKCLEDKNLGELFLKEFPSNSESCIFLRDYDISDPFPSSSFDAIENFMNKWDNTEHIFFNRKLEKIRRNLVNKIKNFITELSLLIRPLPNNINFYTTELKYADIASDEVLLKEKNMIKNLNKIATKIYECHQKLTKEVRKLLNS